MALISARQVLVGKMGSFLMVSKSTVCKMVAVPVCNFMSSTGGQPKARRKPYPYQRKRFGLLDAHWDSPTKRFDENSKIITVDGNLRAGKSEFAKKLAKEFDLFYIEEVSLDHMLKYYEYDFDVRAVDEYLPKAARGYDFKKFYSDPNPESGKAGLIQYNMYTLRWYQYAEAILHLFSTGQGVVLDRSPFSDFVFAETLLETGYMTKPAYNWYNMIKNNSLCDLWKPHLCIYLDSPVSVIAENLKKSPRPEEVNTKILSDSYLRTLEKNYKEKFIPLMKKSSEVLVYSPEEIQEFDTIPDDLERLNLEKDPDNPHLFEMWQKRYEEDYNDLRIKYSDKHWCWYNYFANRSLPYEAPELMTKVDDRENIDFVENTHPVHQYAPGWNPHMGDNYWDLVFSLFKKRPESRKPNYLQSK